MAVIHRFNPHHKPMATYTLVGLNVAVALLDIAGSGVMERAGWARGIDVQHGAYWRIFTSAWVHGSIMHILFNAYGIYVLGSIMERLHGWKPLVVVYFAALLGGGALAMVFMDPNIRLVGASGAAYGLFGAVLGFFYVRTGSIRGIMQIPMGRMLLIWLAFGVFISLQPGISMLGHLGGFVPGVFLGVFFEHRYLRSLDVYHKLGAGLMAASLIGLLVFACYPFTRASLHATQAMRAYERGDMQQGDEHLRAAQARPNRDDGTRLLVRHLELWRGGHASNPAEFQTGLLRWPLTHMGGIGGNPDRPYDFLQDGDVVTVPLETTRTLP